METQTVTPNELAERMADETIELIDVRTPAEFRQVHVNGAKNVPLESLDAQAFRSQHEHMREPLYVICHSGARSAQACKRFVEAGFENVINVDGGTQACRSAKMDLVLGKQTMSLERQVRIAAGALVLLGVLLSYLVHPAFVGFSAFIGAGLVFAGITDTCAMGMVIARMPWNQAT